MGQINYGTKEFSNVKVGDSQVSGIRIGSDLVWKPQLLKIWEADNEGQVEIIIADDYRVYVGAENGTIYTYNATTGVKNTYSTNSGTKIVAMASNGSYVFVNGNDGTNNKIYKYSVGSSSKVGESTALTGSIFGLHCDANYVYRAGYNENVDAVIVKYNISDLSVAGTYINTSRNTFDFIISDDIYLYAVSETISGNAIYKINKSNMTFVDSWGLSMSLVVGGYLTQDTSYLYFCDYDGQMRKLLKSDLTVVSSAANGERIYDMTMIGNYLYTVEQNYIKKYDLDFNLIKLVSNDRRINNLTKVCSRYINSSYLFGASKDANYITKYTLQEVNNGNIKN